MKTTGALDGKKRQAQSTNVLSLYSVEVPVWMRSVEWVCELCTVSNEKKTGRTRRDGIIILERGPPLRPPVIIQLSLALYATHPPPTSHPPHTQADSQGADDPDLGLLLVEARVFEWLSNAKR